MASESGPLDTLIVGNGDAGSRLHGPCVRKAAMLERAVHFVSGRIGVVEPDSARCRSGRWPAFASMADVKGFSPAKTVVHVATSPLKRVACVSDALAMGFQMFVLEKPLVGCTAELPDLRRMVSQYNAEIIVNYPWLATPLTRRIREAIVLDGHGALRHVLTTQLKSRAGRAAASNGSAFDIETPHQVSLALHLAGPRAVVLDASTVPLSVAGQIFPHMGGVNMVIDHGSTITYVRSDLAAVARERRIQMSFEDGCRLNGWYPADGTDHRQVLRLYDRKGRLLAEEDFYEDPITTLLAEAYQFFCGYGPKPIADFDLGVLTEELISTAKQLCGVEMPSTYGHRRGIASAARVLGHRLVGAAS